MEQRKIIQKVRENLKGVRYVSIPKKSELYNHAFVAIEAVELKEVCQAV